MTFSDFSPNSYSLFIYFLVSVFVMDLSVAQSQKEAGGQIQADDGEFLGIGVGFFSMLIVVAVLVLAGLIGLVIMCIVRKKESKQAPPPRHILPPPAKPFDRGSYAEQPYWDARGPSAPPQRQPSYVSDIPSNYMGQPVLYPVHRNDSFQRSPPPSQTGPPPIMERPSVQDLRQGADPNLVVNRFNTRPPVPPKPMRNQDPAWNAVNMEFTKSLQHSNQPSHGLGSNNAPHYPGYHNNAYVQSPTTPVAPPLPERNAFMY